MNVPNSQAIACEPPSQCERRSLCARSYTTRTIMHQIVCTVINPAMGRGRSSLESNHCLPNSLNAGIVTFSTKRACSHDNTRSSFLQGFNFSQSVIFIVYCDSFTSLRGAMATGEADLSILGVAGSRAFSLPFARDPLLLSNDQSKSSILVF